MKRIAVRRGILAVIAACLALAGLVGTGAGVADTADPRPKGLLHPDGRWLKDAGGRVVIVHGLNGVWKTGTYYPPATDEGFIEADAAKIEELGFNGFRLGWIWKGLEPTQGADPTAYLDQIARVEGLLAAHGVYSLIDSHQDMYNERYQGEGFPDWADYNDNVPHPNNFGFPGNYLTPEGSHPWDGLWLNRGALWQEYADAWRAVADRFKGESMVMGYDLLNEPWPGTQWTTCAQTQGCPVFDKQFLQPFQDTVAAAVRAVDTTHIAFYEPNVIFNFGAASSLGKPPAAVGPVGLSFHDYCLSGDVGAMSGNDQLAKAGLVMCPTMDSLVFSNAESARASMGAASLLSEFGAGDDLVDLERYIDLAEQNMVGWMYWQYKNWNDPTGAKETEGLFTDDADLRTLKPGKANVLSRTYPMAIAGTPTSYRFDPATKVFTLEYDVNPSVSDPTVIFVPVARHYGGGYTVTVSGATVTSGANATYLTVSNLAGATHVSVTVSKP